MSEVTIELDGVALPGNLTVPDNASGLVIFAHGSGSSRHSPRNRQVAQGLNDAGLATLLFDLLTEQEGQDRTNVFDIGLLSERMSGVVDWAGRRDEVTGLPVGLFGSSTGAAAALNGARQQPDAVGALVSRGGRVDLADDLQHVDTPTLLIVGGNDDAVLGLNRQAAQQLPAAGVQIVPGAGHLFEGPGELEQVTELAADWFRENLSASSPPG